MKIQWSPKCVIRLIGAAALTQVDVSLRITLGPDLIPKPWQ